MQVPLVSNSVEDTVTLDRSARTLDHSSRVGHKSGLLGS
jgi:hypothetical protein